MDPVHDFHAEVRRFLQSQDISLEKITLSIPPDPELGEASSNAAFLISRDRHRAPREIADDIVAAFRAQDWKYIERVEAAGPGFVNFFLDYSTFVPHALDSIESDAADFGRPAQVTPIRVLIEHTSVNPNKEWHVGHLRNVIIGDGLVRLARLLGHQVEVQNYIDDTGRQAAEAMYALQRYEGREPPAHEKYDHFVGGLYVRLNGELSQDGDVQQKQDLQRGIDQVLREMEDGRYRPTVERVVAGQLETAHRIGAWYDLLVWESDIIHAHLLDEALAVLKRSPRVFIPSEGEYAGALVIRLESRQKSGPATAKEDDAGSLHRVLVRSNGLPTYTGKDIPYMMWKFGLLTAKLESCDFPLPDTFGRRVDTTCPRGRPFSPTPPDEVINVVGEHQALQQQTVIEGLAAAGFADQADHALHLSYGMVTQAHGQISGRKGSGVSADDVLDEAVEVAGARIREKRPDIGVHEQGAIAEAIAVGAVRYLMVQHGPVKPIVFDLQDVVSFEGNTALYLQYAIVRMNAILRRASSELGIDGDQIDGGDPALLKTGAERTLVLLLARFPSAVEGAFRTLGVNLIAEYAHSIASEFSQFYRDCPILQTGADLRLSRLRLLRATRTVLTCAATVLGVPTVERL